MDGLKFNRQTIIYGPGMITRRRIISPERIIDKLNELKKRIKRRVEQRLMETKKLKQGQKTGFRKRIITKNLPQVEKLRDRIGKGHKLLPYPVP